MHFISNSGINLVWLVLTEVRVVVMCLAYVKPITRVVYISLQYYDATHPEIKSETCIRPLRDSFTVKSSSISKVIW